MITLFLTSTALIISAGYFRTRNTSYDRIMDIFNETKLMVIMYHLMLFTMYVPEIETRYTVGNSCFVIVLLGIAINMITIVVGPFVQCRKNCRICCHKRKGRELAR